jgi:2-polyprenyl-6-methoxyphenol hydroxylase-like FAD-dependent oxidoreductase
MAETEVLVVGAGPTGLALALWLKAFGVHFRIIDKAREPGMTSRALAVHARTLEFYRQLGVADAVVAAGQVMTAVNLWVRGHKAGRVALGDIGTGLSPYPYVLILPQDVHERLLIDHLMQSGVAVERPVELISIVEGETLVKARLRHGDGREETVEALFIAGCDGAHSALREALQVGFPGGTYSHLFYVADVTASGPVADGELHVALDDADFLAVFPLKGAGRVRLVGTIAEQAEGRQHALSFQDVSKTAIEHLRMSIGAVNWFSTYRVHHRVAHHFRRGRTFLAGDAAHIHSPVGGQGMNTGIGDATNLAWKLAFALRGSGKALIDSYEPERIAFARRLVETTDRAFTIVSSSGQLARFVRVEVVPRLLPPLFELTPVRRLMFKTISQIGITYRGSPLSSGKAGAVAGGDRLPYVAGPAGRDNFAALASMSWQVHVYGGDPVALSETCSRFNLPLHVFPWSEAAATAGLKEGAAYLVRPDGYVGFAEPDGERQKLAAYFARLHLVSRV